MPTEDDVAATTRDELYEIAKAHDVPGRSTMSKSQLVEALRARGAEPWADVEDGTAGSRREVASRVEAFAELASARATGRLVPLPRHLRGDDRRLHVRQTLREDHQRRIAAGAEGAEAKFDKLAGSLFSFFRGTALLFYRDLAGEDAWMPTVLTLGDVHPENFGVMPSADNVPIFGVNDFDEAYYAPFTWDLKRGAVGFMVAAKDEGGHGRKKRRAIARRFLEGYIDGIADFAAGGEQGRQFRLDNAPAIVAELIADAMQDRSEWLAEEYHDEYRRGFRNDDVELVKVSSRRDEFQQLLERLVRENDIDVPPRAGDLRVKDVAIRRGAGTASLGLARYYLLVEGPLADGTDDLLIELKQARRSALADLVPPSDFRVDGHGERIAHAQDVQLVRGDAFYGHITFEGLSFMSRERAPYRDDIDLDDLSKSAWKDYAAVCGRTLAHAHALSDDIGRLDHDIEPAILESMGPRDLFVEDVVRFAEEATDRVRRDHQHFRADHALGAFRTVDVVYR